MKISNPPPPEFQPITIVVETAEEASQLCAVLSHMSPKKIQSLTRQYGHQVDWMHCDDTTDVSWPIYDACSAALGDTGVKD
jgi:hypothetical protein